MYLQVPFTFFPYISLNIKKAKKPYPNPDDKDATKNQPKQCEKPQNQSINIKTKRPDPHHHHPTQRSSTHTSKFLRSSLGNPIHEEDRTRSTSSVTTFGRADIMNSDEVLRSSGIWTRIWVRLATAAYPKFILRYFGLGLGRHRGRLRRVVALGYWGRLYTHIKLVFSPNR